MGGLLEGEFGMRLTRFAGEGIESEEGEASVGIAKNPHLKEGETGSRRGESNP
jgi:hypothetical protein